MKREIQFPNEKKKPEVVALGGVGIQAKGIEFGKSKIMHE